MAQADSPLLERLPQELRDTIYEMTFKDEIFEPKKDHILGILLACRQSHTEAIEIFYKTTTFMFDSHIPLLRGLAQLPRKHGRRVTRCGAKVCCSLYPVKTTAPISCEDKLLSGFNKAMKHDQLDYFFTTARITEVQKDGCFRTNLCMIYTKEARSD